MTSRRSRWPAARLIHGVGKRLLSFVMRREMASRRRQFRIGKRFIGSRLCAVTLSKFI
jgi:hypothetical protein